MQHKLLITKDAKFCAIRIRTVVWSFLIGFLVNLALEMFGRAVMGAKA